MKRIALDLDGVCYNYSATAVFLLNHYKGYNLDWTETNSWDWLKEQVSNNDWLWLWSGGVREGLFRYGSLIKGAAEGVKELSKFGKICAVTSRPTSAINDTLEWLAFMKWPVAEVHILSNGENKAQVRPDLAIDDAPHNIEDYVLSDIPSILFMQKHNRWYTGFHDNLMYRAEGWKDVLLITEKVIGKS